MAESCFLVLEDGDVYAGRPFGAQAPRACDLKPGGVLEKAAGEVVFNTGMTGYQEILTDPSYTGQMIVMTYPHIGNYGTDPLWSETGPEKGRTLPPVKAAGMIVRSLYTGSVPPSRKTLDLYLREHNTPGISEVDTRALTLRIRDCGSPRGVLVQPSEEGEQMLSDRDRKLCTAYLSAFPSMEGRNLIDRVGTGETEIRGAGGSPHIALVDCGAKANIVRELVHLGCQVSVLPQTKGLEDVLKINPDAVLFSNGPGDPAVLAPQIELAKSLFGRLPVLGICLGHQIIALAMGAKTYKMKFGHHGVNHPVRDERTGRTFVTSQNHGFAVAEDSLPEGLAVWFKNANDGTVEGLFHRKIAVMCAQFHPESAPGPYDSKWIFEEFMQCIRSKRAPTR